MFKRVSSFVIMKIISFQEKYGGADRVKFLRDSGKVLNIPVSELKYRYKSSYILMY